MSSVKPIREKDKISRRTFFTKSVGLSSGLALLTLPGMIAEVSATKGDKPKEELLKELEEKVEKFMPMYRSCALTSFAVLNDQFQLKADNKTIRALMPFTGGLASRGETCGAVSGSLLAIGLFFESINQKGQGSAGSSMKYGGMFFDRFAKEFGSTRCKEVVKHQYGRYYDFQKPEDTKLFMEAAKSGKCMEVVKKAVLIAGEIIIENS